MLTSSCALSFRAAMSGDGVQDLSATLGMHELSSTWNVYDVDRACILLLSGDIEVNPGPVEMEDLTKALDDFAGRFGETLMQRFSATLAGEMQILRKDISEVAEKVTNMEKELLDLQRELRTQKNLVEKTRDAQAVLNKAVEELDAKIEEQEIRSRRDNILLHGVPEIDSGSGLHEDCETVFVETVNDVLSAPLQIRDLVRAHRLGKRAPGKTRPIIAKMAHSADKFAILQKRKELREKRIGVSTDLTTQQREEISHARESGLFAYYKGNVLHTEVRRAPPVPQRPNTRSYARVLTETDS